MGFWESFPSMYSVAGLVSGDLRKSSKDAVEINVVIIVLGKDLTANISGQYF
jgi:hypothetical protein